MPEQRFVSVLLPVYSEGGATYIFLQKRSLQAERSPGNFGFWGGGREGVETAEETLIREVREELGIGLDIQMVRFFGRFEFPQCVMSAYALETFRGWEKTCRIGEGDYGQWFELKDVFDRADVNEMDKTVLRKLDAILVADTR